MIDYFLHLLDYEYWANQQVLTALQSVTEPPPRAVEVMAHVLGAQAVWLARAQGQRVSSPIWPTIPIAELPPVARQQYTGWRTFVAGVEATRLSQSITYQTSTGATFTNMLAEILTHVSHHAAYHRGQVIQLLRPQLTEAPFTDYVFWLRAD